MSLVKHTNRERERDESKGGIIKQAATFTGKPHQHFVHKANENNFSWKMSCEREREIMVERRRLFRHIVGRCIQQMNWICGSWQPSRRCLYVAVLHLLNVHCTLSCLSFSFSLSFRDHLSPRHAIHAALFSISDDSS